MEIAGLSIEQATGPIRDAVQFSASLHALTLLVGGNNAVTRPGVLGLGLPLEKVGLITLDAHFDMRDLHQGLSNGNPVRALIEDGLPGANIAQVGLASFANSEVMHRDAVAAGNLVITIGEVRLNGIERAIERALAHVAHCEAIVVDCDIDVIDRCAIPGGSGRPARRNGSDRFLQGRPLSRIRSARARHRPHRMGPAARPDRPQRADGRALGGGVPRGLRAALSFRRFPAAEVGQGPEGDREAQLLARDDAVLPLVPRLAREQIGRARLHRQAEAPEAGAVRCRNRRFAGEFSDTPTTRSKTLRSLCQPMPAPGS